MSTGTEGLDALDAALPESVPVLPGLSVSGRYILDGRTTSHGGNGLKAIPLPDGRLMMAVVDALGTGAMATSAAVRVLAVVRGLLESGVSASAAVKGVNRYAARAPLATGASLAVAVVSQQDGSTEVATAGNPPPVKVRSDGEVVPLGLLPSRPLGLGGEPSTSRFTLDVGDTLILHTDGLVTGQDGTTWSGIERLHALLGHLVPGLSDNQRTETLSAQLLTQMHEPHGYRDDVALLMAERAPHPQRFHVGTAPTVESAVDVLNLFGSWLSGLGISMLDEMAINQAVKETVDNVVTHAYEQASTLPSDGLRISAEVTDAGVVCTQIEDSGAWRTPTGQAGRGLVIAGGLVDKLRLLRGEQGTQAILEQRLTRPIPMMRAQGALRHESSPPQMAMLRPDCLYVDGALSAEAKDDFRDALHRAVGGGTHDATVDLSDVTVLSPSAIRVLFEQSERCSDSGVSLTVAAAPGTLARRALDQVAYPRTA